MGAKEVYPASAEAEKVELSRKLEEQAYLANLAPNNPSTERRKTPFILSIASVIAIASLVACLVIGVMAFQDGDNSYLHTPLLVATIIYFITATYAYLANSSGTAVESKASDISTMSEN
jgi:NCS1 family nucleobase:cation symporter-1